MMPSNAANPALGTLQKPLVVAGFNVTVAVCDCTASLTYKKVEKITEHDYQPPGIGGVAIARKDRAARDPRRTQALERAHRLEPDNRANVRRRGAAR